MLYRHVKILDAVLMESVLQSLPPPQQGLDDQTADIPPMSMLPASHTGRSLCEMSFFQHKGPTSTNQYSLTHENHVRRYIYLSA